MSFETKSSNKVFGGVVTKYSFVSEALGGLETNINVFLPSSVSSSNSNSGSNSSAKVPVIYYLSGLTCTEDNAVQKGHFFQAAEEENLALVFPDTSPRGAKIDGEDESYDFGSGAGFYLNATKSPWNKHYNMYNYVVKELPSLLQKNQVPIDTNKASIFGHSMGGHGALTLFLKNLDLYKSCSAFSPICNPTECPWGKKAFEGYLTGGLEEGKGYDATILLSQLPETQATKLNILIDSGKADNFYTQGQLLPENFDQVARNKNAKGIEIRLQEGYDHSYFFISTFAAEHVKYHAKFLHA